MYYPALYFLYNVTPLIFFTNFHFLLHFISGTLNVAKA